MRNQFVKSARAAAAEFSTPKAQRKTYLRIYKRLYANYMQATSATWRAARLAAVKKWKAANQEQAA